MFRDRLFVYTGTWYTGEASIPPAEYDLNKHLGYAVWTADGADWHGPVMLEGTFGHYVWRAATFDGKAFLCGRRKHGFDMRARGEGPDVESVMLESDDGLVWKPRAFFQEKQGDETAFSFEPDGTVVGIARRGRASAQLLRSRPPYADWHRSDLGRYVGGPLLARWGARWVVGGRNMPDGGNPETMLFWLDEDMLRPLARLPSAGDNSYPGFLAISPARAVVSWYSSHEHGDDGTVMTAIYMADLEMLP